MSILKAFNPYSLPKKIQSKSPLAVQREIILQHLLNTVAVLGVLGLVLALIYAFINHYSLSLLIPLILFAVVQLAITAARKLPYSLRTAFLLTVIAIAILVALSQDGLNGMGLILAIALIAVVAVLIGPRAGYTAIAVVAAAQALIGWMLITGRINLPWIPSIPNPGDYSSLIMRVVAVLFSAIGLAGALNLLTRGLTSLAEGKKKLAEELVQEQLLLERRVQERTQEWTLRASQLEAACQVANTIMAATSAPQLLSTTAEAIQDRFDFYQVNIFLNDERNEYAVLQAATGEIGKNLLEENLRLKIGDPGIVSNVAEKGKPRIARDVEGDPIYVSNPALPETRSELAVPLFLKGAISGVLDVQSNQVNSFHIEHIEIITRLADQLSQALENTHQLENIRHTLADLENANLQTTQAVWNIHLRNSKRGYAFRYRQARIEKLSTHSPESLQALKQGSTIVTSTPAGLQSTQPFATLAIPIKIRNQTLGVINMRVAGGRVSPELIELVEGAVNRLSAALENARLLEEIQARSERERLVGDIASKVRSATDIDSILRTAAGELGRSLGVSEVVIQLDTLK